MEPRKASAGRTMLDWARDLEGEHYLGAVGAKFNNALTDWYDMITTPGNVEFLDLTEEEGLRIYRQSVVFLLARALHETFSAHKPLIKHSLGNSYYCEIKGPGGFSSLDAIVLEAKMRQLVERDEPIIPVVLSKAEALQKLRAAGHEDTVDLLAGLDLSPIKIYESGLYSYFSYYYLTPRTGMLGLFELEPYSNGFILRFPSTADPARVAPRPDLPKLSQIWSESEEWAKILGVRNLAGLRNLVKQGEKETTELVLVAEALHEKKIAQIADEIFKKRKQLRVILIAGPSSSGKTTFAQRLAIQLRVLGLKPISISTDDYFVNREYTPRDEAGEYDFEALETVDIELFNRHLGLLLEGQEVECPIFDFHKGARSEKCYTMAVEKNNPVIIEGIHALNEKLTPSVARENKYKIYISALTQIAIDGCNRIPTTDVRLIRRMVRDSRYRSASALATLKRWTSVRRGEEKNIFPYQEDADIMFNSALVYELGVLKGIAYPLLNTVSPREKECSVAHRLQTLLSYFPDIESKNVPLNSILREFIGGSVIHGS